MHGGDDTRRRRGYEQTHSPETVAVFRRVAHMSADTMVTTERVGGVLGEDVTEAPLRPMLAQINRLGFVTTDSHSGLIVRYALPEDPTLEGEGWQRAYVHGFMLRTEAYALKERMDLEDGLMTLVSDHATSEPMAYSVLTSLFVPAISVGRWLNRDGTFVQTTDFKTVSGETFASMWENLLPESNLSADLAAMTALVNDVVYVCTFDLHWGRHPYMFERLIDALSGHGVAIPKLGHLEPQAGGRVAIAH